MSSPLLEQVFIGSLVDFISLVVFGVGCIANQAQPPHTTKMRLSQSVSSVLFLATASIAQAASSWSFDEGLVSIAARKGADGVKEK